MSTRLPQYTVPSTFQDLDDHVTTADEYLDVHTLQTARKNANIILARGSKHPIWHWSTSATEFNSIRAPSRANGDYLLNVPIYVPPMTQKCRFVGRFLRTNGLNVELYGAIDGPGVESPFDTSTKITVSSGSQTKATMDIPVPPVLHRRGGQGRLVVGVTSVMAGSDTDSAVTLLEAEPTFVRGVFSSTNLGNALYFTGTGADIIEPRIIKRVVQYSGGGSPQYRLFVDEPFNQIPSINDHAGATRLVGGLTSVAMSLYALDVSEFGAAIDFADPEL